MCNKETVSRLLMHVNDLRDVLWARDIDRIGVEALYMLYFVRDEMLDDLKNILTELYIEYGE